MLLYEDPRTPNCRRVIYFLNEKGFSLPRETLDINAGDHRKTDFVEKNPYGRVPLLELDDGFQLSESMAICRYLEAQHPNPILFGNTDREQAIIEMWNRRVEHGLLSHVGHAFRHIHPAMTHMEVPQVKEWGLANRDKILRELSLLDKCLGDAAYLAGDHFSVADITLYVGLDFMRVTKIKLPEACGSLLAWQTRMKERKCFQLDG